jgi:hypothetical protein
MSTKEEDQKETPENAENPEEQKEEEEEQVDVELQKEMKGLKIEDSDFTKEPKAKKVNKKLKNSDVKKSKKKGQDFLDYANKNNIQINIEYEENKFQLKKKDDQKTAEKTGNTFNDNKRQYNRGGYKNDKNHPQKRMPKYTGNKFDNFGQRYPQQPHYYQRQAPKLGENKEILEYLEKIFSEEHLNKETYIRNRLKDGKILLDDIVAYNDIKSNNINAEKLMEVIKESQKLECVNEEGKNYIKIKDFDKLKLLTIEQIIENKKQMRMQKNNYMQPMRMPPPYPPFNNYISMQNNYYLYNGPTPYGSPSGYMPLPENK